jgi:1-acyl-sn-glycerol-3-phosphate acyltransferase
MFLVGKFLHKMLGQPINRENDREALKTILNCIRLLDEDKASVAVFPEGGIRGGHVLHPLRHGVFKIALRAKVPIVVCTLRGTHTVLGKALKLQPSQVELHLVGVIPAEELEGKTAVQVGEQVYEMMARDLGPELVLPRTEE